MSFTIYRSSAGSGKTYTLVREYLKILLQDTGSFRNILAVTFTNKASGEMKDRVLSYLEELANPLSDISKATKTLLPSLIKDTGLDEAETGIRAEEALKKILHNYSDFSIGTIDSFSQRVIRSFAHDFSLPVNFKVEVDSDELIVTAVDLLLDKAGDDDQLTELLVKFLESNIEDDKSWAIDKTLMEFSNLLLDEESLQHLPKLKNIGIEDFKKIADSLRKKTKDFEKTFQLEAGTAWKAICDAGLDHQAFAYGKSGISWYFEQLSAGRTDKLQPSTRIIEAIANDRWTSGKASSADIEKIENIKPLLLDSFQKLRKMISESYPEYILLKLLGKSLYPLAVLNSIGQILLEYKKQNNIVHISEFNSRIAKIVMDEPVPFIYERIGERYHHILIDEFQDTSALQWQNFVPLIENSLASGYFNMVVGDAKQAIYRWRNGDVEQFTSLPALRGSDLNQVIRERENALTRNFTELRLDQNFRSGPEIVSFNNDFFGFLSNLLDEPRRKVYDGLSQVADTAREGGYINISFSGRNEDEDESAVDIMLQKILGIIDQCCKDRFRFHDIAVLCRMNSEASLIAQYLIEHMIPVVSGESLQLNYSPLVRMLTAMVRYIFSPVNSVIQAEILTHYSRICPAEKTFYTSWLSIANDPDRRTKLFDEFLDTRIGGEGIIELRTLPVYDLFIKLINSFCPSSAGDPYIQFFLNAVLKFSSEKSSSAPDFLKWWDDHYEKQSVVMPSGFDAVQVMTIHKAKGLQFPVVIYPFAGDRLKNTKKYLWTDLDHNEVPGLPAAILMSGSEIQETVFADKYHEERQKSMLDLLNILYVVMTRPEQRLYLLPPIPSKNNDIPASVPSFIKSWLQHKELWEEKRFDYEFGYPGTVTPAGKEELRVLTMPGIRFGEWRNKIRIRSSAPEMWNLDDPDKNRRFGNVLHTVLAGITPENKADDVIGRLLENGFLDRAWESEIRRKIDEILNNPDFAFIFDEKADIRPEAEILTPEGHAIRPDRVIVKGEQAVVVDYKTGRPMEKYRSQLIRYAAYLKEMGYKDVKKYLLYLEPDVRIEEVE